jgi:hypothetical protein
MAGRRALTLLAAMAFAAACAGSAASSTLGAARVIGVGSAPDAVAIGDVTGDGRNDVVLTTGYANDPAHDFRVVVLAQRADGTLAAPSWYPTAGTYGNRPQSVAVGDVTGDGNADVVVGLSGLGVQVFAQSGAVLSAPTFVSTNDSHKIRLGKLDADADLDIAGVGWGTNTVTVLPNDGSGRFASSRVFPAQHGGYEDLEVGDVSGDGRADIVVMSGQLYTAPNVSVLAQTADGFAAPAEYRVGANVNTQGIGIGDVTGDGRSDVVASYGGNSPSAFIAVLAQTTSGTLASPVGYTSYDIPEPVEVADIDLDGKADVITAHGGWLRAGVYRQVSGGTLGPEELAAIPYASHYNPHGLSVGDVDGNGSPDVVIADYNYGIVILPGTPPPTADRAVALVPSAATVKQRKPFAFDLKVSNLGPSTTNATATLTLSGAFTGLAAAAGCSVSGATVTCTYASLASGATVTARVTATAGARGKIAATAAVAGSVTDPNAANDTAAATVAVK